MANVANVRTLGALPTAAAVFVAGNLLHTADHLRQGTARLTTEVFAGGTVISLGAFLVLYLALRGDPRARVGGIVVGGFAAVGVAAAHLLPHWSAFSDSYPDIGADGLAYVIVLIEIATAVYLAVTAWRVRV
jgi:predicted permease